MSGYIVEIYDSELENYIREFSSIEGRLIKASSRWVRRLARRAESSMRKYSRPTTPRGTGKLSSSITTEYNIRTNGFGATIYVPKEIKYQFAAEYGFNRRFTIKGSPRMTFPASSWKGAVKVPHRGYFVFTKVVRGRYKGKRFTEKAFRDTIRMYEMNKIKILNEVGNVILFSRS